MAPLDWVFVLVLLASTLIGAWRGLVFEVLSAMGWVAAFFAAQWFAADVGGALPWRAESDTLRYLVGFLVVFVAAVFVAGLLAWILKKMIEAVGLRPADRSLGALFGALRGMVLLLAVAVVGGMTPMHEAIWWQESVGARWLEVALQGLKPMLPEEFGKHLPV